MSESIWTVIIYVMPHSTENGSEVDHKSVGGSYQRFTVDAVTFDDACELAKAIQQGIESNPNVWQTLVVGIIRVDFDEHRADEEVK